MKARTMKMYLKKILPNAIIEFYYMKIRKLGNLFQDRLLYINYVNGKKGLEIGGPSFLFYYSIPIYKYALNIDGLNFANETLWEGKLTEGFNYKYYSNKVGYQYIEDATNLSSIPNENYDFVLSSHVLEHIANPLKAISEWARVLKHGGYLILVLPNKKNNFDHRRDTTIFKHLLEDYSNGTDEDDLTHLEEILTFHDLSLDLPAGDFESFKNRSLNNYQYRALHHHVFSLDLMSQVVEHFGFNTLNKSETLEHLVIIAEKP